MAIAGLILADEGVFKGTPTADVAVLSMYWQARESDEYQERRTELETL
jgi:hypothetical protein